MPYDMGAYGVKIELDSHQNEASINAAQARRHRVDATKYE